MLLEAVIVDDEPIARSVLREELAQFEQIRVVGEAESGFEALSLIQTKRPSLVFLDLQMPGMSGFELIKQVGNGPGLPVFIVTTAFDRFAIQAFESGAIDYLLKPIRQTRLAEAIEKATRVIAQAGCPVRRILAKSGSEYLLLAADEVFAFRAEGDVVWIITETGRYLASDTLREIQSKLRNTSFKRVHREALVNTNHIRKMSPLTSQRWLLTLSNDLEFIVSKRQTKTVRDIWSW